MPVQDPFVLCTMKYLQCLFCTVILCERHHDIFFLQTPSPRDICEQFCEATALLCTKFLRPLLIVRNPPHAPRLKDGIQSLCGHHTFIYIQLIQGGGHVRQDMLRPSMVSRTIASIHAVRSPWASPSFLSQSYRNRAFRILAQRPQFHETIPREPRNFQFSKGIRRRSHPRCQKDDRPVQIAIVNGFEYTAYRVRLTCREFILYSNTCASSRMSSNGSTPPRSRFFTVWGNLSALISASKKPETPTRAAPPLTSNVLPDLSAWSNSFGSQRAAESIFAVAHLRSCVQLFTFREERGLSRARSTLDQEGRPGLLCSDSHKTS